MVDTDRYCLACYRYIELNPVRAGLLRDPADYRWSSCRSNGLGKPDSLVTPHATYLLLGSTASDRRASYRALFAETLDDDCLRQIRNGVCKGVPVGKDRFKACINNPLGRTR